MRAETIIRGLTICSLAGLLFGVGLRLTMREVIASVRKCRLALIVEVNFIVVPVLVVAATWVFGMGLEISTGMILLAAAPFAPVVPVFARMARADLALAAGLTTLFPVLSALFSPFVVGIALMAMPGTGEARFNTLGILLVLMGTITLPLCAGMSVHHFAPMLARRSLRPIEMVSEFAGALSLAFVTFTEWSSILTLGWSAVLVMVVICEISLVLGWLMGGPERISRQVVGLGTSNRNIALAILMALDGFGGTEVLPAVVGNGLLLILLGLLHVAFWRFGPNRLRGRLSD